MITGGKEASAFSSPAAPTVDKRRERFCGGSLLSATLLLRERISRKRRRAAPSRCRVIGATPEPSLSVPSAAGQRRGDSCLAGLLPSGGYPNEATVAQQHRPRHTDPQPVPRGHAITRPGVCAQSPPWL